MTYQVEIRNKQNPLSVDKVERLEVIDETCIYRGIGPFRHVGFAPVGNFAKGEDIYWIESITPPYINLFQRTESGVSVSMVAVKIK